MRNLIVILIANFALVSIATAHTEICKDLQDCRELQQQLQDRIKELQQQDMSFVLGDLLKYGTGQYNAKELCESKGLRLPTARELAVMASRVCTSDIKGKEPCGAGIVELSEVNGVCPNGFKKINIRNENSTKKTIDDSFCYSNQGYERPSGELGEGWIWSASLRPGSNAFAFYFGANDGIFESVLGDTGYGGDSARCVISPARVK